MTGIAYVSTWRGVAYIAKWPKKRSRPLHPKTVALADRFSKIGRMVRYLDPKQQVAAIEATKGTPLYPRDILSMGLAGTLFYYVEPSGQRIFSMATRVAVSESLDVIGDVEGTLLVRSGNLWVPVLPTVEDDFLCLKGTPLVPTWQPQPILPGVFGQILGTFEVNILGQIVISGLDLTSHEFLFGYFTDITTITGSNNVVIRLEINNSLVTSGYKYSGSQRSSAGSTAAISSNSGSAIPLAGFVSPWFLSSGTSKGAEGAFHFSKPTINGPKRIDFRTSYTNNFNDFADAFISGGLVTTSDITGFTIFGFSGFLTSGKLTLIAPN